jgi:hypothetical protein
VGRSGARSRAEREEGGKRLVKRAPSSPRHLAPAMLRALLAEETAKDKKPRSFTNNQ